MKRIISLILAAAMVFPFAACSDKTDSGKDTTTDPAAIESTDPAETSLDPTIATPTAGMYDMEGKIFNFYVNQWGTYDPLAVDDIDIEEATGESYNDAAFDRNAIMADKMNCGVDVYERTDASQFIQAQNAGDNSFDLAIIRSNNFTGVINAKTVCDYSNLPYFDPEAAWWDTNAYEDLSITGHHIGAIGDITSNIYICQFSIFFNKRMVEDYNLGDIYQKVRDGLWTYDLMNEYAAQVAMDLDNNGIYDTEDQYGFAYIGSFPIALLNGFGIRMAETNAEGVIEMTLTSEDAVTKMLRIVDSFKDQTISFNHGVRSYNTQETEVGCFVQGKVLFNQGGLYYAPETRLMEDEFGIIPLPKFDINQAEYLCPMGHDYLPVIVIPKTCTNFEELSTFMEWYGYYGYTMIRPEVIETLIKGKVARDEESIEFIEYIFDHKFLDIGASFNFGNMFYSVIGMFNNLNDSIASILAKTTNKINKSIEEVVESVEDIE